MRLTVQLEMFNRAHPMAFAILWIDKEKRQWSREGHFRLELPKWGSLHVDRGNTLVCKPNDRAPVYVLEGLNLDRCYGLFQGEAGRVQWYTEGDLALMSGHWRVQCIDNERAQPEHGLFATAGDS